MSYNGIYCCTKDKNNCPKKDTCYRYNNPDGNPCATLYKMACTEENGRLLYKEFLCAKNDIKNEDESEVNKVSNEG